VLQVRGPRAQQFVDLLSEYSGWTLVLVNQTVTFSTSGLINPFESQTLQDLVGEILRSPNVVEIVAQGGKPTAGFFFDAFFSSPVPQGPRGSVFVDDILKVQDLSPVLARVLMGHVLREYFLASHPPGQAPSRPFFQFHVSAIQTEAQIASDLMGRPVWTGNRRAWEAMSGTINVRSYGPNMKFQLFFTAGHLRAVKGP
jgi:hypothetical protein